MPIGISHGPPEEIRTRTSCLERAMDVCFISFALRNLTDSSGPRSSRNQFLFPGRERRVGMFTEGERTKPLLPTGARSGQASEVATQPLRWVASAQG